MTLKTMQPSRALWLLPALLVAGCTMVHPYIPETGHYYINPQSDFTGIGKVVVLEPANHSDYPNLSEELARATCRALQKKHLFNVLILPRTDPAWDALQLDQSRYTLDQMRQIRQALNADAIVVGHVTDYQPYPHMLVGLNLKMLDLRNGHLVWGMEQLWDSTDQAVQRRMKGYYYAQLGRQYEPMNWQILITSPTAFHKFVACEIAQTLPEAARILRMRPATANRPAVSENVPNVKKTRPVRKIILPLPRKPLKLDPTGSTIATDDTAPR